jgi:hypothetical protein
MPYFQDAVCTALIAIMATFIIYVVSGDISFSNSTTSSTQQNSAYYI